jgi:hypothetical protein
MTDDGRKTGDGRETDGIVAVDLARSPALVVLRPSSGDRNG